MKTNFFKKVSLILLVYLSFNSCVEYEDVENNTPQKCIVGVWDRSVCNETEIATLFFDAGGTGYYS